MKKRILTILISLLIIVIALVIALVNYPSEKYCTLDAKVCPDGSSVGRNPDNSCEFYECPSVEKEKTFCNDSQRGVPCTREYIPVCGFFDSEQIQCIKEPCAQTYGNKCDACSDETVLYWEEGECSG